MYFYSFQNHFKFGYDLASPYQLRKSKSDIFQFEYGKREDTNLISWSDANRDAARKIRESHTGKIWILYSGGTDSEVCLQSFIDEKIDVHIACLRFSNGLNEHDLKYVRRYAEKSKVKVDFFDINLSDFWSSSRMLEIVDSISCVSPILAAHLWLADQLDGVPVIAQGEPHLKKEIPDDYIPGESPYLPSAWYLVESERLCSLYQYFMIKNKPAVPGFFQYTANQIHSFCFHNPYLRRLVSNEIVGKLGTRTSKNQMIQQFYPDIEMREKYTGYEYIQVEHDYWRQFLAKRFPDNDNYAKIEYKNLQMMLEGQNGNKNFR